MRATYCTSSLATHAFEPEHEVCDYTDLALQQRSLDSWLERQLCLAVGFTSDIECDLAYKIHEVFNYMHAATMTHSLPTSYWFGILPNKLLESSATCANRFKAI